MQRYRFVLIIAAIFLLLLGGSYWYLRAHAVDAGDYHIHAGFVVIRDNAPVDFSDDRFMHIAPCGGDDHSQKLSDEEEQMEKGHLHDNVGDVVHVHRKNAKWKDLFTNIDYDINGTVVGYINGERSFNVLNKKIGAYDRALFIIGDVSDLSTKLEMVPSVDHIKAVEAEGESC